MRHQPVLYPLKRGIRDMFDRFVEQIRQYRNDGEARRGGSPHTESLILCVGECTLGLTDGGVYRERWQGPGVWQIVVRHGSRGKDIRIHT